MVTDPQDARGLVRPLEREWKDVLDRVLKPMGYSMSDVARLGPRVAELSRAYNAAEAEGKKTKLPLEARVAFSFPRDVPKGAAAVREIVANGTLTAPTDRPLRILDLGAGLGAMTWGVVRALTAEASLSGKPPPRFEAMLVDEDADALRVATAIARERAFAGLEISTRVGTVAQYTDKEADLVLLGQVLSELDPRADPEARLMSQTDIIRRVLARSGTVVIVEPALRDRTRHLHALRDRLVVQDAGAPREGTTPAFSAFVHAPCLHSQACGALAAEGDWCHDDLAAIELPNWVTPIAQAAGLRWQGLTFSYLVLRTTPPERAAAPPNAIRFRVTSGLLQSKGKTELFACCEDGSRPRIRRLEREGTELEALERGDVVTIRAKGADAATTPGSPTSGALTPGSPTPGSPIDERGRIAKHVSIDVGWPRH